MRKKKIPLRKCMITGVRLPKGELLRIAYSKDGLLSIDPSGRAPGRGFYIVKDTAACEKAKKKNVLFSQLKIPEQEGFYDELIAYVKANGEENGE
ncbi:RNase P modulator RnpM [Listeria costaricensis]|uniref:RNase P modulator RnpM n=1 Tax=Listeria costaricensis TaxID=2026604 RepID=UPI000C07BF81|nr:YlxR family protein [Listeria costaricensis]